MTLLGYQGNDFVVLSTDLQCKIKIPGKLESLKAEELFENKKNTFYFAISGTYDSSTFMRIFNSSLDGILMADMGKLAGVQLAVISKEIKLFAKTSHQALEEANLNQYFYGDTIGDDNGKGKSLKNITKDFKEIGLGDSDNFPLQGGFITYVFTPNSLKIDYKSRTVITPPYLLNADGLTKSDKKMLRKIYKKD